MSTTMTLFICSAYKTSLWDQRDRLGGVWGGHQDLLRGLCWETCKAILLY